MNDASMRWDTENIPPSAQAPMPAAAPDHSGVDGTTKFEGEGRYVLSVPDEFAELGIEASVDDPFYRAIVPVLGGMEQPMSQDEFGKLAAAYYGVRAEEIRAEQAERRAEKSEFIEAFNDDPALGGPAAFENAQRNAQAELDWAHDLLGPEVLKDPGLGEMLNDMAHFSNGLKLIRAFHKRIGERTPSVRPTVSRRDHRPSAADLIYDHPNS